ncbi:MAG: Gfo/Idh/MocA family oxidoreductase [Chlorobi bacterium]|nr:Gfo/Idh/MocA family oxidoreductase [Chlorobiota bacterium]
MSKSKLSRRSFLKRGAAVTAGASLFPTVVPASVLGLNGAVPPSDRIVMGLVGSGGMGNYDMKQFLQKKETRVVAACDVDNRRLISTKARIDKHYGNNDARIYKDFIDFFDNEKLDAVILALPDHWHSIIAVTAANKGLDIYGEKPLSRTIKEGRAIVDAVQKNNVIWQTGSWQRSVPNFKRAAELVRNGVLGKITHVEVGLPDGRQSIGTPPVKPVPEGVDWDLWLGPAPKVPFRGVLHFNWRWILDYSGGQLTDWAGHHVDIAHWGLGFDDKSPVKIKGKGIYPVNGIYNVPVEYLIEAEYENGLPMTIANARYFVDKRRNGLWPKVGAQNYGMGPVWFGENGWIQVNRSGLWASDPELLKVPEEELKIKLYDSKDHWQNFLDCIKTRKKTITPVETAHNSISVALTGEIAMMTEQELLWDRKTETFTNSDYANRLLSRPFREPWRIPEI